MSDNPSPKGYFCATPYLVIADVANAIKFYQDVFGATELFRLSDPSGILVHVDIKIGDSPIKIACEIPDWGNYGPLSPEGGTSGRIHLHVEDADAVVDRAVQAGAKLLMPVSDQFYGQRSGRIEDPFGHIWLISTHQEDLTQEQMQSRFDAFLQQMMTDTREN